MGALEGPRNPLPPPLLLLLLLISSDYILNVFLWKGGFQKCIYDIFLYNVELGRTQAEFKIGKENVWMA